MPKSNTSESSRKDDDFKRPAALHQMADSHGFNKTKKSESLYAGRDVVSSRIPWKEVNKVGHHNVDKMVPNLGKSLATEQDDTVSDLTYGGKPCSKSTFRK